MRSRSNLPFQKFFLFSIVKSVSMNYNKLIKTIFKAGEST